MNLRLLPKRGPWFGLGVVTAAIGLCSLRAIVLDLTRHTASVPPAASSAAPPARVSASARQEAPGAVPDQPPGPTVAELILHKRVTDLEDKQLKTMVVLRGLSKENLELQERFDALRRERPRPTATLAFYARPQVETERTAPPSLDASESAEASPENYDWSYSSQPYGSLFFRTDDGQWYRSAGTEPEIRLALQLAVGHPIDYSFTLNDSWWSYGRQTAATWPYATHLGWVRVAQVAYWYDWFFEELCRRTWTERKAERWHDSLVCYWKTGTIP